VGVWLITLVAIGRKGRRKKKSDFIFLDMIEPAEGRALEAELQGRRGGLMQVGCMREDWLPKSMLVSSTTKMMATAAAAGAGARRRRWDKGRREGEPRSKSQAGGGPRKRRRSGPHGYPVSACQPSERGPSRSLCWVPFSVLFVAGSEGLEPGL
jgi:hypothetical protein